MYNVMKVFPINEEEYLLLEKNYGKLCHQQAWNLLGSNARSNHTDDQADIAQEMRIAMMKAGSYYKRQVYLDGCMAAIESIQNPVAAKIALRLKELWEKKGKPLPDGTKFCLHHEVILEKLVEKFVPADKRPNKAAPLEIGGRFPQYCKSITWNRTKAIGKRYTREKSIRAGLVSLSDHDFLSSERNSLAI